MYDLYLNHLGKGASSSGKNSTFGSGTPVSAQNADPHTVKRMIIVKKSKSSLLLPLLVPFAPLPGEDDQAFYNTGIRVPEFRLVGSIELFKYHF